MSKNRKRKTSTQESAILNRWSYLYYYRRLLEIACASIEWLNLPKEIDERFLEHTLNTNGMAVFYKDDVLDEYVALSTTIGGPFSIYRVPDDRTAWANNGYQYHLTNKDSVLIFNNYLRTNIIPELEYYAYKLYNIDRTIDINVHGQKTPILLICDEAERLALENLYMQYDGNEPVIKAYKGINTDQIKAIPTLSPYVSDKLYDLKLQIWNEALTFLGVANTTQYKKERLISSEIETSQGQVIANRLPRLRMRKQACDQINEMFGLNVGVQYYQPEFTDLPLPLSVKGGEDNE